VTGERTQRRSHCRGFKPGGKAKWEHRSGSQETGPSPARSGRGEDPEKEVLVERDSLDRRITLGEMPLWSWLLALLLLGMLFTLLFASGDLLVPEQGHAAGVANYLHEFAHDGRHLLAVPCH
jgi:hypothetical protein